MIYGLVYLQYCRYILSFQLLSLWHPLNGHLTKYLALPLSYINTELNDLFIS